MKPPRPDRGREAAAAAPGRVRIIGGHWRGSKLHVADRLGLRPTADRVRETLFNWLQPHLPGAHCLDLFAGSGALGFEAASRGAAGCVLVERDPDLARLLRANATRLQASQLEVATADAVAFLAAAASPLFDIAFVDPPFTAGDYDRILASLQARLAPQAFVYVESPRDAHYATPPDWRAHREGSTRDVRYVLHHRVQDGPATLIRPSDAQAPPSA